MNFNEFLNTIRNQSLERAKLWKRLAFSMVFFISGCFDFNTAIENSYHFEGIQEISSKGDNIYEINWLKPADFPLNLDLTYNIQILGSISQKGYLSAGLPENGGKVTIESLDELELFEPRDEPTVASIANEESIFIELNLEKNFMHAFKVIPENQLVGFDEQNIYFIKGPEDSKFVRDWEFEGLRLAELRDTGVHLEWDPPTGVGALNQKFIYEVYTGVTFNKIVTTTEANSFMLDIRSVDFIDGKAAFGVRAVRESDLTQDDNKKVLFIDEPAPLIFAGLLEEATVVSASQKTVSLSWKAAENAIGNIEYIVYGDRFFTDIIAKTNDLSIVLDSFEVDKNYHIGVRAKDARGEDTNQQIVSFKIPDLSDKTPPVFDGIKSAIPLSQSTILVSWEPSNSTDLAGYYVYFSNNLAEPIKRVDVNNTQIELINLDAGKEYELTVRAYDNASNIDLNEVSKSARTLSAKAPKFLGLLSAQPAKGLKGISTIKLTWEDAEWANPQPENSDSNLNFELYRWKLNDNANIEKRRLETDLELNKALKTNLNRSTFATKTEVEITGLDACHEATSSCKRYCFLMRALDSRNVNSLSDLNQEVFCLPTAKYEPPSFSGIGELEVPNSNLGFTSLIAKFPQASGGFEGYRAYYKLSSTSSFDMKNYVEKPASVTEIEINGLSPQQNYDVMVLAFGDDPNNPNDSKENPSLFGSQTKHLTAITKPQNPLFAGITSVNKIEGEAGLTSLKLKFPSASGARNRYKIYKRTASGAYPSAPDISLPSTGIGELSYDYTGLTLGETYCFYIQASYSESPAVPGSADILVSNTDSTSEECQIVSITQPEFLSIASVETSSVTSTSNTSALKITFKPASGLFNRYIVNLGTTAENLTQFGTLDVNTNIISGSMVQCVDEQGDECIILQGLNFDTDYFLTMHVAHTSFAAVKDEIGDNILHPAQKRTALRENSLTLEQVDLITQAKTDSEFIAKYGQLDGDTHTELVDSSTTDSVKSTQLLRFSAGTETDVENELESLEPIAVMKGSGYDVSISASRNNVKMAIANLQKFGDGSDGDLVGGGDLNLLTTSTGRTKVFQTYQLNYLTISGSSDYTFDVKTNTYSSFPESEIKIGDEVLIYTAQYGWLDSNKRSGIGIYTFATITDLNFPSVTIDTPIYDPYPNTSYQNRHTSMLMTKIPKLNSLTLTSDGYVRGYYNTGYGSNPSGAKGGLLLARVNTLVDLRGNRLHMDGRGYGGVGSDGYPGHARTIAWSNTNLRGRTNDIAGGGPTTDGPAAGGGHGGAGGSASSASPGGGTIGTASLATKMYFGGGGATGRGHDFNDVSGGAGGGIVVLFGKEIINGTISANGISQSGSNNRSGSGAGGTVWVTSLQLKDVTISADGGDHSGWGTATYGSAGGGGGRVRIDAVSKINLTATANAGSTHNGSQNIAAQAGTVYYKLGLEGELIDTLDSAIDFTNFENLSSTNPIPNSDFSKYFDNNKNLYLLLETPFPSSQANSVNSSSEVDYVRVLVNWQ